MYEHVVIHKFNIYNITNLQIRWTPLVCTDNWISVPSWVSVQFSCSVVSDSLRPHEPQHSRPPSNHLILCRALLLPSVFPSIRVFSNGSALRIRWPKYWSFSFNISASNEHTGLISFRMDWFDLLAVQRTLKSLVQHHSSKVSILHLSAFFIFQLSHPYITVVYTFLYSKNNLLFWGKGWGRFAHSTL